MNGDRSRFRDAIRVTGLEPPDDIVPGKLYRFPGVGKRKNNTAGWCKLFDDGRGGCFGDWSSGFSENWQERRRKPLSCRGRAALLRRIAEARAQSEADRRARQAEAAGRASAIWNGTVPAPGNHPYLTRKAVGPYGARLHKGALVLPVMDFAGKLTSLQFIDSCGGKLLLSDGRKRGCVIPVAGDRKEPFRVIVCEGWATGCTLAEAEPAALVLAAIDAGNLEPAAVAARHKWPSVKIVVAGDDDRLTAGNPGATKARAAAIAANALLALPQWPEDAPDSLTDFNDLAVWLKRGSL